MLSFTNISTVSAFAVPETVRTEFALCGRLSRVGADGGVVSTVKAIVAVDASRPERHCTSTSVIPSERGAERGSL